MKWKLRISAPTIEGIERQLAKYFYTDWKVNPDDLSILPLPNGKRLLGFRLIKKGSRYRFEEEMDD